MWTRIIFLVFVLISTGQAKSYKPAKIYVYQEAEEGPGMQLNKNIITIPAEDGTDSRRFFVLSRDSSPNSEKVNAGFELFGIPIEAQVSYTKEKEKKEVPPPRELEITKPVYIPVETEVDSDGYETNPKREVVRVPAAKKLKHRLIVSSTAYAIHPESETFPVEQDSRRTLIISGDPTRRSKKVTAGIQFFGIPIGEFIYNRDEDDNENGQTRETEDSESVKPVVSNVGEAEKRWARQLVMG